MLRTYEQFCQEYFPAVQIFPSTHIMLSSFISYLFLRNYQPSTIASYVSAVTFVHKINALPDPANSFLIKKILKGTQNLRPTSDMRLPITRDILQKLINALPVVIRDNFNRALLQAMMTFAYFCFLRIGEIAVKNEQKVIQRGDIKLEQVDSENVNMTVILKYYKHSDLQPKTLFISSVKQNALCPVSALMNYLKISGHTSGPLFKFRCGTPVSSYFFKSSLKLLLQFIGLNTNLYTGHSFRIGAATSAAARGVPLAVIQHMGRWKSNAFQHYIRLHNF